MGAIVVAYALVKPKPESVILTPHITESDIEEWLIYRDAGLCDFALPEDWLKLADAALSSCAVLLVSLPVRI